jgi:NDP-4-keto-2,6-dideoxyhexose 3-C-methyltransferase
MVTDSLYTTIERCRICRKTDLQPVVDLGQQALTGCFPAADEPSPPKAPLLVCRCQGCGLVQLKHSVRTSLMFGENYGYRSGINATMRNHLAAIASRAEYRASLKSGEIVLDIGCNDGTLLNAYGTEGIRRIGLDPIANIFRAIYHPSLEIDASLFTKAAFKNRCPAADAKIITSISMFYDLEDPSSFAKDIASVLHSDGLWILEQSYLPMMLDQTSFDTICHEHLEYYALQQIHDLSEKAGLRILDVEFNNVNGGSFQVWICHRNSPYRTDTNKINAILGQEKALGLDEDKVFADFRDRVQSVRDELRTLLVNEVKAGKKIFVYGASTKGNVLLQYLALDTRTIVACADRNPMKWGRRTPGTDIPIVSEDSARQRADFFLVLPWHFREEFLAREHEFLEKGGKLIFPLPRIEIVGR